MLRYTQSAEKVHQYYLRAKERIYEARFELAPGVIAVQGEARIIGKIDSGRVGIGISIATKLGLRVSNLPIAPPSTCDGPAAVFALASGEATIRNLDRCGLLNYLLPELTDCRNTLPEDSVHAYTVFEHTIRAIRNLDQIPDDGFLAEARDSLIDLETLYMATLLHDVGRLYGELGHETKGAEIAEQRCDEWALSDELKRSITWLIANHLEMSRFIRSRDLQNPATIEEFAGLVGDIDRLRQLTLLTYADIKAVNETTLTPALLSFLRELYERTMNRLLSDTELIADPAVYRKRLVRLLRGMQTDEETLQQFVETLPAHYVMSTSSDLVQLHFEFAKKAALGESTVELYHRPDVGATDFTVCTKDSPGVLSRLLGVIYAHDLSVVGIRAATTNSDPAVAIDVFTLHFGGRPVPPATCKQVSATILAVLDGKTDVDSVLRKYGKDPDRRQDVFNYVYVPGSPGILEFRSPRGRGVAYRFAKMIAEQKWNVLSARVGQWAGNATAAYYVEAAGHRPLTGEEVESALGPQSSTA
jgi:[protein-PII] uridylyltransferase